MTENEAQDYQELLTRRDNLQEKLNEDEKSHLIQKIILSNLIKEINSEIMDFQKRL